LHPPGASQALASGGGEDQQQADHPTIPVEVGRQVGGLLDLKQGRSRQTILGKDQEQGRDEERYHTEEHTPSEHIVAAFLQIKV
jgi:hypothetical protein